MIDFINVSIQYTGDNLFDNATFKINKDDRLALAGSNGSGKTTLLRMFTGIEKPSDGKIVSQKNISIGYLPQEFINTSDKQLFNEVRSSLKRIISVEEKEAKLYSNLESATDNDEKQKTLHEIAELNYHKEHIDYYSIDSKIEKILSGLGFEEKDFNKDANEFSGGWQMRIEMAKILLGNNDLILFDEPTNHLDIESQEWLIEYLTQYSKAYVIVSHDKHFLDCLTNKTIEIFNKKITFFNGKYSKYLELRKERDQQLLANFKNQEKIIKQKERFIERFRYKNTKAKQVQSRVKQLNKLEFIEIPEFEKSIKIKFPDPPKSGSVPLQIEDLSKSYVENEVFKNIDLQLESGDKIAFVGSNGSGKTTLAKIIAKKLNYDSGKLIYGHNTLISYYAQEVSDSLDLEKEVIDIIMESAPELTPGHVRSLLGAFLFNGDEVFKKIKILSGGEKSRVALARILVQKANLIVLDEPTNHLDFRSKTILQKALKDFPGTLVIVSHDVDFLQPIANKVLELKHGSSKLYFGSIDYYLFKRKEEKNNPVETIKQKNPNQQLNKKDQKRLEAEKRQKKYAVTKGLIKEINELEKKIEKLESDKEKLEADLSLSEIFENPEIAKSKNIEYENTKQKLELTFNLWTEKTMELEEAEKLFKD